MSNNTLSRDGVSGAQSIEVGSTATASGINSIAIGHNSNVLADYAVQIKPGVNTGTAFDVTGNYSVVIGADCVSDSLYGIAIGYLADCQDQDAIVIGHSAGGVGWTSQDAVQIGSNARAGTADNSVVIGHDAIIQSADSTIAIGPGADSRNGTGGIAIGDGAVASTIANGGNNCISIGTGASAIKTASISIGDLADSNNNYAISIGANTLGHNTDAIAVGADAVASGVSSIAMGDTSYASGAYNIGLGRIAQATGTNNSIAIGNSASSTHGEAIAIGKGATTHMTNHIQFGSVDITGSDMLTLSTTKGYAISIPAMETINVTETVSIAAGGVTDPTVTNIGAYSAHSTNYPYNVGVAMNSVVSGETCVCMMQGIAQVKVASKAHTHGDFVVVTGTAGEADTSGTGINNFTIGTVIGDYSAGTTLIWTKIGGMVTF